MTLSRNSEKYFTCKDLWRLNNVWTLFWGNWPSSNDTDARRNWSLAFVGVWDERLGTESQLPRYIQCDIHINGILELLNWYYPSDIAHPSIYSYLQNIDLDQLNSTPVFQTYMARHCFLRCLHVMYLDRFGEALFLVDLSFYPTRKCDF